MDPTFTTFFRGGALLLVFGLVLALMGYFEPTEDAQVGGLIAGLTLGITGAVLLLVIALSKHVASRKKDPP